VKNWKIIADNLSKAGWSWGCVSAVDSEGRTIWIADAHRDGGKRFVVRADEKLTAFVELESADIKEACERFNLSLETWTRQERAFGLLRKVYAKRAKIRGEQPHSVTANIISWP
jgi:hypothetical protein